MCTISPLASCSISRFHGGIHRRLPAALDGVVFLQARRRALCLSADLAAEAWTLDNYRVLLLQTDFPIYFANSLIVALGATSRSDRRVGRLFA